MNKLDIKALGLAIGIYWGLCCVLLGLSSTFLGFGTPLVELFASEYIGYKPTILGSLIGGLWGFVDGFIGGAVVAWLYNKLAV